ncbi:MAG: FeoA domain-containing protein [Bacilli bacterium]|nr:FeoA domain-containing protein [Bacilli bacterium]
MPIMIAPTNTELVVRRITGSEKVIQHLRELGIVPAMKCLLLASEPSGIIIRVGESRLALDRNLARLISVSVA